MDSVAKGQGSMLARIWLHIRKLWPQYAFLPVLPLPLYGLFMAWKGLLRWDHVLVSALVIALAYTCEATKRLLVAMVGFVAIFVLYDVGRFIRDWGVTVPRVINCGIHDLETSLFGFTHDGARIALQDYFLVHNSPVADLFFAVPYGCFIIVSIGYAAYLFVSDQRACQRYSWAFFSLNVLGILTYHLAPAAPPWYFHKYGCAIHLDVPEFEGLALARVDSMVGIHYFADFYGKAAEVFGALPSLHVAYPLLILLEGWRRNGLLAKAVSIFYFAWMCVAAVYLDHHWITDIILGWAYALVTFVVLRKLLPARDRAVGPQMLAVGATSMIGDQSKPAYGGERGELENHESV